MSPTDPPPRTVVVGMIIDRRVVPGRSKSRAERIGMASASLPMSALGCRDDAVVGGDRRGGIDDNEALNVDSVLELMARWWENHEELLQQGGSEVSADGAAMRNSFADAATKAMQTHVDRHPNRNLHSDQTGWE